jgi:hypothetical protein
MNATQILKFIGIVIVTFMILYFLFVFLPNVIPSLKNMLPSGVSDALSAANNVLGTSANVVNKSASALGTVWDYSPAGLAVNALSNVSRSCRGGENRGTPTKESDGTACSWLSNGTTCYLHARGGKWVCDESCSTKRNCCKCSGCKWDSGNGVCLTTG